MHITLPVTGCGKKGFVSIFPEEFMSWTGTESNDS